MRRRTADAASRCRCRSSSLLRIGAIVYAGYISLWDWGLRGATRVPRPRQLRADSSSDPIFHKAVKNTLYYAIVWVPLDDGPRAVPGGHRQPEDPRPDVLPGRRSTSRRSPARRRSRSCGSSSSRPTACSTTCAARSGSTRSSSCSGSTPNHNWIGDQQHRAEHDHRAQRLDDVRHVHAVLPGLAADDQQRHLRGGGDRRGGRVADVPADHVPAAAAGPLLRRDGRGHRRAPAVRPGATSPAASTATPNNSLTTIVLLPVPPAFADFDFGYAAAVGIVLFVLIIFTRRSSSGASSAGRRRWYLTMAAQSRGPRRGRHRGARGRSPRRSARRATAGPARAAGSPTLLLIELRAADVRPVRLDGHHVVQDPARLAPADASSRTRSRSRAGRRPSPSSTRPLLRLFLNSLIMPAP